MSVYSGVQSVKFYIDEKKKMFSKFQKPILIKVSVINCNVYLRWYRNGYGYDKWTTNKLNCVQSIPSALFPSLPCDLIMVFSKWHSVGLIGVFSLLFFFGKAPCNGVI